MYIYCPCFSGFIPTLCAFSIVNAAFRCPEKFCLLQVIGMSPTYKGYIVGYNTCSYIYLVWVHKQSCVHRLERECLLLTLLELLTLHSSGSGRSHLYGSVPYIRKANWQEMSVSNIYNCTSTEHGTRECRDGSVKNETNKMHRTCKNNNPYIYCVYWD